MNFEIVDNIFQILVLFCVMTASAVTACKKKSRDFLLLTGGYGCFGITAGTIVLRCMEVITREREHHLLDGIMLLVAWLQVLLYIVSEFIKDYTRFNLYFAVDITLTLTMAYLFFALRKEVERG